MGGAKGIDNSNLILLSQFEFDLGFYRGNGTWVDMEDRLGGWRMRKDGE